MPLNDPLTDHRARRHHYATVLAKSSPVQPEGFENAIPPERLCDLIAYLRQETKTRAA